MSYPTVRAYFGRVKAACLCSYCCSRNLDFMAEEDWVVARTKEGNGGGEGGEKISSLSPPPPPPFFFASKNIRAPEENACTAG